MTTTFKTVVEQFIDASKNSFQKLAIELDEQNWTYAELLFNSLRVAHHLRHINEGDLVFQLTKTSFEEICAMIGIVCAGGTFLPLSPSASMNHLQLLIDQFTSQYVLLHEKTRTKFNEINNHEINVIDLDSIVMSNLSTMNSDENAVVMFSTESLSSEKFNS